MHVGNGNSAKGVFILRIKRSPLAPRFRQTKASDGFPQFKALAGKLHSRRKYTFFKITFGSRNTDNGPLALGFEAPMFVPIRTDPERLTAARSGEFGKGLPSRPFSASAGTTVLVTGLVVVSYILNTLRPLVPEAIATLDWRSPLAGPGRLMLFEAFITDQRKTTDTRHIEDAHLAIAAFQRGMRDPANFQSSVEEPICLSLLGAMMLRTGWATDPAILSRPCLVVRAHASEHHP